MEWIDSLHWEGILIGICTFLIIGLFHPIVVKAEYYLGTRCFLDHQGGLRTARTRTERLVPDESEAEEGI